MKKIVYFTVIWIFLLAGMAVAQPPAVVIGDFEKDITTAALLEQHDAWDDSDPNTVIDLMDLWDTWWRYKPDVAAQVEVSSSTTIGITLNNQSLRVEFPVLGQANNAVEPLIFDIGRMFDDDNNDVNEAFYLHTSISMDVTIDPADWTPLDPDLAVEFTIQYVVNSQNGGWNSDPPASDDVNPDNPGAWNSVDYPTLQTRHLSWGLSAHQTRNAKNPGTYFETLIQIVNLTNTSGKGVLYLDNIQFNTPVTAGIPRPGFNEQDIDLLPILGWTPGALATSHNVYFGTDFNEVNEATTDVHPNVSVTTVDTASLAISTTLDFYTTYYWRVDETDGSQVWPGEVWKFTTGGFQLIDGFEYYKNSGTPGDSRIFETWLDGNGYTNADLSKTPGNGTNMSVGADESPYGPETDTVYDGLQSMPLTYENSKSPYYSEADRTFDTPQDFTTAPDGQAFATLDMQIHGRYLSPNMFTNDGNNQYTVIGSGRDIIDAADEFHFVYQPGPLEGGPGSISAKIESIENTHRAAKAGVMIRDNASANPEDYPGAVYAGVFTLPGGDIVFQYRDSVGGATEIIRPENNPFTLPYWVKISTDGSYVTASMSADGDNWVQIAEPEYISMIAYTVVGLAVSSHVNAGTGCEAVFSNVKIEGTGPTLDVSVDIGLPANDPTNVYVRLEDNNGMTDTFNYPDDPNGVIVDEWDGWKLFSMPLSEFSSLDLTQVKKMIIGVGDKQPGSDGKLFVDHIRLTLPSAEDPNETE